jgi:hypothetical protein
METLTWGTPSLRTKKVEKYTTPVVTMTALTKKGAGRKFTFNKAAQKALNLEGGVTNLAFGFGETTNHIVIAAFESPEAHTFMINKSYGMSDKKTFDYIVKRLNLNTDVENELHFVFDNENLVFNRTTNTNSNVEVAIEMVEKAAELVKEVTSTSENSVKDASLDLDEQW